MPNRTKLKPFGHNRIECNCLALLMSEFKAKFHNCCYLHCSMRVLPSRHQPLGFPVVIRGGSSTHLLHLCFAAVCHGERCALRSLEHYIVTSFPSLWSASYPVCEMEATSGYRKSALSSRNSIHFLRKLLPLDAVSRSAILSKYQRVVYICVYVLLLMPWHTS